MFIVANILSIIKAVKSDFMPYGEDIILYRFYYVVRWQTHPTH